MVLNVFHKTTSITKDIVLFDKDNIHRGRELVGQQSVRLQMEVHTPQQHKNAKVKWLNSKNFLGKPTENRDEAFLPISRGISNDY
ncbi:hypothetical protein E4U30_002864 [Claviceps sp. LM220 group G6]|nr:hypothetical protein E4U15_004611 [Claviceps sp. LM218 group G6]KAG6101185.1 hypothetical protein E4U30_002864 [Claviceps sp. LM220 group G6]KAG6112285.1 hypothetical protein E4U14_002119 [Claviceps sp. LM454 group G7]